MVTASQSSWLQSIWPLAQMQSQRTGIDAGIIAAQAAHESAWGTAAPGGNLFGIKGNGTSQTTREYLNGKWVTIRDSFSAPGSATKSFEEWGRFINGKRYAGVRSAATPQAQASALQSAGYGTDPNYANKLLSTRGAVLRALGKGLGGAVTGVETGVGMVGDAVNAVNPVAIVDDAVSGWVLRGSVAIVALLLLGAAIFSMLKVNPVSAVAKAVT